MLSRLLHVRHPTAKQAVITAIDLLGLAVSNLCYNKLRTYFYVPCCSFSSVAESSPFVD